jgi:nucleotide-binding universal stress UspA family protein
LKPIPSKILLPVVFIPSTQAALDTAADFALPFHAELFLVNVVPSFSILTSDYAIPHVQLQQKEKKRRAEQQLAKA